MASSWGREEVKNRLLSAPRVREAYENPPLHLAVARAVVERRKELGITQEELAERMGTSQAQIWRIESGSFNPTSKTLSRVEKALGIPLGSFARSLQRPRESEQASSLGSASLSDPQITYGTAGLLDKPDYGKELYLRFVEDIVKRLTDEEWERVRKVREPRLEAAQDSEAEEGKP